MADNTKIEWTDSSWTPIRARNKATGKIGWHCEHDTAGCINCYAEAMNLRLGTGLPFKPGHRKDIEIFLDEKMLLAPLRWKKPRMIFVCSMTDLFASFVKDEWIDRIFAVMALCPQHTFQVLTKRSARMREYCSRLKDRSLEIAQRAVWLGIWDDPDIAATDTIAAIDSGLPNVWLGVSCEDQATAARRIPDLLATPAAVRFVSYEPALGPVDFTRIPSPVVTPDDVGYYHSALERGDIHYREYDPDILTGRRITDAVDGPMMERLDWIIVGGESGKQARAFDLAWARSTIEQCKVAGVACFVKQLGARPVRTWAGGIEAIRLNDKKGGDWSQWPEDLRVREMPA